MHELGIVYHIIRDVENVARANGVRRVSSVTLLLGEVSGVVPDLLLDAWRWAADKKPIAQGAELIVEPVEAVTHCEACGRDYATVEHGKTCPHCGSGETYLLQGQEVMIKQIETPDEDPADAAPVDSDIDTPDAVDAAQQDRQKQNGDDLKYQRPQERDQRTGHTVAQRGEEGRAVHIEAHDEETDGIQTERPARQSQQAGVVADEDPRHNRDAQSWRLWP